MTTLILYATKHGATHEIARRIAGELDGPATFHNLKQGEPPSVVEFDRVILGSSLYVGAIAREAKNFIAANKDILLGKPFGLFLSGFQPEEEQKAFESNFPPELLKAARTTCFLGGIYDPKKAGVLERLAMKAVAKTADYTDTIDNDRIRKFAGAVQA